MKEITLTNEEVNKRIRRGEKLQYVRTVKGGYTVVRVIKS